VIALVNEKGFHVSMPPEKRPPSEWKRRAIQAVELINKSRTDMKLVLLEDGLDVVSLPEAKK